MIYNNLWLFEFIYLAAYRDLSLETDTLSFYRATNFKDTYLNLFKVSYLYMICIKKTFNQSSEK